MNLSKRGLALWLLASVLLVAAAFLWFAYGNPPNLSTFRFTVYVALAAVVSLAVPAMLAAFLHPTRWGIIVWYACSFLFLAAVILYRVYYILPNGYLVVLLGCSGLLLGAMPAWSSRRDLPRPLLLGWLILSLLLMIGSAYILREYYFLLGIKFAGCIALLMVFALLGPHLYAATFNSTGRVRLVWLASLVLLVTGIMFTGFACYRVAANPGGDGMGPDMPQVTVDLRQRWVEERYIFNRQNPYDIAETTIALGLNSTDHRENVQRLLDNPPPPTHRNTAIDPDIGPAQVGGYPPWSFLTAAGIILPVNWTVTRFYFIALNLLSLTVLCGWAYRVGRPFGVQGGVLLAAAALAMIVNHSVLRAGTAGLVINAMLIGSLCLDGKVKGLPSGVLLGMSFVKPHVSWLFWPVFLVRRRYWTLLTAMAYTAGATAFICWLTSTGPLEMIRQARRHSGPAAPKDGDSLLRGLTLLGVEAELATLALGLGGVVLALVLMYRYRHASLLSLFAVAGVIGRLATYHHRTDNTMVVFLLVAIGQLALSRPTRTNIGLFSLTGLTLWVPVPTSWSAANNPGIGGHISSILLGFHVLQACIWLLALSLVLRSDRQTVPAGERDSHPPVAGPLTDPHTRKVLIEHKLGQSSDAAPRKSKVPGRRSGHRIPLEKKV